MHKNAKFLARESTLAWISQFDAQDQLFAAKLIESMRMVSRDRFIERLRELVLSRIGAENGVVGLYAERELRQRNGIPNRLFKETRKKPIRAFGTGPLAVSPIRRYDQDIGSEGIVAQMLSEICRQLPRVAESHPGPDTIRKRKIRRFIVVTDFIGSGDRALKYLRSAWRVRSVRSWWSGRSTSGMAFEVIAYSGTSRGLDAVRNHACRPVVSISSVCPTIRDAFVGEIQRNLIRICEKYDPVSGDPAKSLGFGSAGVLMAFAHGIPNNAPRMLFKASKRWIPLFAGRTTAEGRLEFESEVGSVETIQKELLALRQKRLAESPILSEIGAAARKVLLVLAVITKRPRDDESVSLRTGLTVLEVRNCVDRALANGWITPTRGITEAGQQQLAAARRVARQPKSWVTSETRYYPKMLRAPVERSS